MIKGRPSCLICPALAQPKKLLYFSQLDPFKVCWGNTQVLVLH